MIKLKLILLKVFQETKTPLTNKQRPPCSAKGETITTN